MQLQPYRIEKQKPAVREAQAAGFLSAEMCDSETGLFPSSIGLFSDESLRNDL
jgi:hypothetical protein